MLNTIDVDSCIFVGGTFHLAQAIYKGILYFQKKKGKKGYIVSDRSVQADPFS